MSQIRQQGWWYGAGERQRLAQVKAAAGIGLTARETAILLGAQTDSAISNFASRRSIRFWGNPVVRAAPPLNNSARQARADYFHGTPSAEAADLAAGFRMLEGSE
jgi:hypothetical protein